MRTTRFALATGLVLVLSGGAAGGTVTPEYRAVATELMELTGAAELSEQIGAAVTAQFSMALRQTYPDISPRAYEIVEETVREMLRQGMATELADEAVNVYARYFTEQDLRELLEFYRSPVGRKVIENMPAVMAESMQVGQRWAERISPKLQEELQKRLKAAGLVPG
ncbi:MAG: DUF2059 domain-containing protein [Deltaproteobacteria bacterium]|nr:DUF2059 domain-containing protein [Deltaproteobacteria bacterium]